MPLQFQRAEVPLTGAWRELSVRPRGETLLGISFRTPATAAMGLDPIATLDALLQHPFPLIRLGAHWNRLEPAPGEFVPDELDRQVEAAEQAGKQIILSVGPVKTFGYPEFFVPHHHLPAPLPEGRLVTPSSHPELVAGAVAFASRVVERYRRRPGVVAWQVEHEAVDPLGVEHTWRLSAALVEEEVRAVRAADPTRPIMMNGFLPLSTPVRMMQWWRCRDQGDSLAVAQRLADIVGVDCYPRHALARVAGRTLYLDGAGRPWPGRLSGRLQAWARRPGRRLMVSEGQAEPWETVTTPPSPAGAAMHSCPPERVIGTYNECMAWARQDEAPLWAYLFWGAEYWILRQGRGDASYLGAFLRVLDES
jgi:hypothetical protein